MSTLQRARPVSGAPPPVRLRKELGLFDVYAISTGAMFSSGFFLLPGLAAAMTGPSVALAYLVAGIFILPPAFSVAELATAMPRAGGAYYFLDRSLGPMVGTVGGLGTWLALVLKSAFALVGMGAYLALYVEVPIKPLAVGLVLVFTVINVLGAKETSGLQRILVAALLAILGFFIVQGSWAILSGDVAGASRERFTPFLPFGMAGFMGTVGFVFVSYAGLTKVASVSEEVRDPEKNIPRGMLLSLATASFVYTVGVFILVAVLPPEALRADLTPVATAAAAFFDWLPGGMGVALIVVAAIAAFASTGNAGILSASRYPLAMARDRLVPSGFETLGRFHTPTLAIGATALVMIASIVLLDIEGIAKLASAFQLLLFSLLSLAVIIMRESRIEGYDPGYRSPLYPWMQVVGFLAPIWLIAEMGEMAILFTLGLVSATIGWYFLYARPRVERAGAIFHTFARLGERRHGGLDLEMRGIVKEKGLREEDPFDEVVARAEVLDFWSPVAADELMGMAAAALENRIGLPAPELKRGFTEEMEAGFMPVARGTALPHIRVDGLPHPAMLLVRCASGLTPSGREPEELQEKLPSVRAVLFLVSCKGEPGQHLRLLGHLATQVDDPDFLVRWLSAGSEDELRTTLVGGERFLTLRVRAEGPTADWVEKPIRDLGLPGGVLVALIRREGRTRVPGGSTRLEAGDHLTLIGEPDVVHALSERYGRSGAPH